MAGALGYSGCSVHTSFPLQNILSTALANLHLLWGMTSAPPPPSAQPSPFQVRAQGIFHSAMPESAPPYLIAPAPPRQPLE